MSSTPGSKTRSAEAVGRATVIAPDERPAIDDARERLERVAGEAGVELVDDAAGADAPELAVVLGGDGTMLRALKRFLGTGVPVIGVNFGTVGFPHIDSGCRARGRPGTGVCRGVRRLSSCERSRWSRSRSAMSR